jgi:hypothetical protein
MLYGRFINSFMVACETLLSADIVASDLTEKESQIIQYYISSLSAKFPALLE